MITRGTRIPNLLVLAGTAVLPPCIPENRSEQRVVTVDQGAYTPSISPDGSTIAVGLLGKIWVLSLRGGEARQVSFGHGWNHHRTWSSDGEPQGKTTLLSQSLREGIADFIADFIAVLIAGRHIHRAAHEYGIPREADLWSEFQQDMRGSEWKGWLYGDAPPERPSDLRYFIGYRIAQAFYDKADDKRAAIREILGITDAEEFLTQSGYAPH